MQKMNTKLVQIWKRKIGTYLEVKHGAKWDAKLVAKMDAILDANLDDNMVLLRMQIWR